MTSSLVFFPLPPKKKSASGYTEIDYFSLLRFPSSTTNQFTQKLIASRAGGLLWLGTTCSGASRHASGHSWAKARMHRCTIAALGTMRPRTRHVTTGRRAGILLDVIGRAHPGQEESLLTPAGPHFIAEPGRKARPHDCPKLSLSGLCS